MTDFFYSQNAAQLQANHDKVSATTGALIDENNLEANNENLGFNKYVENRFKGNQNWNVSGSTGDLLPSATPTLYTFGAEIAAGRFVTGANLVNATYTGGLFNADSGSYYIEYDGDFTNDFYGIKLADNTIVTTGCALSLVSGKTRLTVDMSLAPAHKFPGLSSEPGVWPDINDDESKSILRDKIELARTWKDVTAGRGSGVPEVNDTPVDIDVEIVLTLAANASASISFNLNGYEIRPAGSAQRATSTGGEGFTYNFSVAPNETYTVTWSSGAIKWSEKSYG